MKYQNYAVERYKDLRQMLRASAKAFGTGTLFLQKTRGKYRSVSYEKFYADVNCLGTALLHAGLAGKKVALAGENCYAWAVAYMAIVCGVGTVVPLDAERSGREVTALVSRAAADAVICSDAVLEKFSSLKDNIKRIPFSELRNWIREGSARIQTGDKRYFDVTIDDRQVCAILFSADVPEDARGVMLSHRNLCFNLSQISQMIDVDEEDVFLSVLPLHHAYECTCGFLWPMSRGCMVAFSDGIQGLGKTMKEISPSVMISVPSMVETMHERIRGHLRGCGAEDRVRRMVAFTDSIPNLKGKLSAKKSAFSSLRKSFGGELRLILSCGGKTAPEAVAGLRDLGILVLQGYEIAECSSVVAINRDTWFKDDSVGLCPPDALLDIADMQEDGVGEIRYHGDGVMVGYYQRPEQTHRVIRDGWFYTGDMGYLDSDGFLYVTGRKENAIDLGEGRMLFPEELEAILCRSPYVKEAVVVGYPNEENKTTHVVALIHPNGEALKEMYGDGVSEAQIESTLSRVLAEVNGALPPYQRIEVFVKRDAEFPKTSMRRIRRSGLAEESFAAFRKKRFKNI